MLDRRGPEWVMNCLAASLPPRKVCPRKLPRQPAEVAETMGPGWVKRPKFNLLVELPSRFCRNENRPCWQRLSGTVQRENGSTHIQLVRLFTQPGPGPDIRPTDHSGASGRPPRA